MRNAFIFDFDGTLLDSMHVWDHLGYDYLVSKGVQDIPHDWREIVKPLSLMEVAEYFIKDFGIDLPPQTICDEINGMLGHLYGKVLPAKDGAIKFVRKHADKKMCVATATDEYLVRSALRRLGIENYFAFIITSAQVGNSKQQPDIFLEAARRLGSPIEDCVVFEDALHAIRTAKRAGFYTVGLFDPSFTVETEEIKQLVDQYAQNLSEVVL